MPALFSHPKILSVAAARFIARVGGEAAFFIGVWGLAAFRFHASPSQIALLMAVLASFSMVGAALSGAAVDRFGPRNVLIGAQIFYVPVALAVSRVTNMQQLIAMCALFGLSTAPIMTATGSFAPYLATEDYPLDRVNALLEGVGAVSFVFGPGLGAVVSKAFSREAVFYLDALLTTIGVLLVLGVKTPPARSDRPKRHPLREVVDGVHLTYSIKAVRYYVLMGSLVWFSFGSFGALEPLFYRDVVGVQIETVGWVNSIFGLGIGLGAFLLTRMSAKAVSARGLVVGVIGCGLGSILYVGTADLRVIAFGALAWGAVIGGVEPLLRTLMQLDAPEDFVGRVMGTAQLHRSAGELLPLALAPGLAALFGVQKVMIGGGLLAAIMAMCTFGYAASIDREGRREQGPLTPQQVMPLDEPISPLT